MWPLNCATTHMPSQRAGHTNAGNKCTAWVQVISLSCLCFSQTAAQLCKTDGSSTDLRFSLISQSYTGLETRREPRGTRMAVQLEIKCHVHIYLACRLSLCRPQAVPQMHCLQWPRCVSAEQTATSHIRRTQSVCTVTLITGNIYAAYRPDHGVVATTPAATVQPQQTFTYPSAESTKHLLFPTNRPPLPALSDVPHVCIIQFWGPHI
jgi:hypothetical protein